MIKKRTKWGVLAEILANVLTIFTHWLVFYFVIVNACKSNIEASMLSLSLPSDFQLWENIKYVLSYRNFSFLKSFWTSFRITFFAMLTLVLTASSAAFVLERRKSSFICKSSDKLIVACLTIPANVITTYFILRLLHVDNTLPGLILVQVAALFPFCTMMYKGFIATIPTEIDEAAIIDGCGSFTLFWRIIFPILKPITASILVLRSIVVFNDFQNAQYYLSGSASQTVQICVYVFKAAFATKWAYLFTASILASVPLLIMYALFNKKILEGMTSGAVKG